MDMTIYVTEDYSIFKRLKGNREVKSYKKIIESILKVGYILSPICVNENYEVIDGQNRLEALIKLGLPVHYYIVEGIGIEEARSLNIGRTNWKPIDYARSFAEEGNLNYARLLKLIEETQIPAQWAFGLSKNIIVENGWIASEAFKYGDFLFSEEEYKQAIERFNVLAPLIYKIKKCETEDRLIFTGLAWSTTVDGVNVDRLLDKFSKNYDLFDVSKAKSIFELLDELYNSRLSAENRIYLTEEYKKTFNK